MPQNLREFDRAGFFDLARLAPLPANLIDYLIEEDTLGEWRTRDQPRIERRLTRIVQKIDDLMPVFNRVRLDIIRDLPVRGGRLSIDDFRLFLGERLRPLRAEGPGSDPNGRMIQATRGLTSYWEERGVLPASNVMVGGEIDYAVALLIAVELDIRINNRKYFTASINPSEFRWWAYAERPHAPDVPREQWGVFQLPVSPSLGVDPNILLYSPYPSYASGWMQKEEGSIRFAGTPSWERLGTWSGKKVSELKLFSAWGKYPDPITIQTELNYLAIERILPFIDMHYGF